MNHYFVKKERQEKHGKIKIALNLPKDIHDYINDIAFRDKVSFNRAISDFLRVAVEVDKEIVMDEENFPFDGN